MIFLTGGEGAATHHDPYPVSRDHDFDEDCVLWANTERMLTMMSDRS